MPGARRARGGPRPGSPTCGAWPISWLRSRKIRHMRLPRISPFAVSIIAGIGQESVAGDLLDVPWTRPWPSSSPRPWRSSRPDAMQLTFRGQTWSSTRSAPSTGRPARLWSWPTLHLEKGAAPSPGAAPCCRPTTARHPGAARGARCAAGGPATLVSLGDGFHDRRGPGSSRPTCSTAWAPWPALRWVWVTGNHDPRWRWPWAAPWCRAGPGRPRAAARADRGRGRDREPPPPQGAASTRRQRFTGPASRETGTA